MCVDDGIKHVYMTRPSSYFNTKKLEFENVHAYRYYLSFYCDTIVDLNIKIVFIETIDGYFLFS